MEIVKIKGKPYVDLTKEERLAGRIFKEMYMLDYYINKNNKLLNKYELEDKEDFKSKLDNLLMQYPFANKFMDDIKFVKKLYANKKGKVDIADMRVLKAASTTVPLKQTLHYVLSSALEQAQKYINENEALDLEEIKNMKIDRLDRPSLELKLSDNDCAIAYNKLKDSLKEYSKIGKDIHTSLNNPIKNASAALIK